MVLQKRLEKSRDGISNKALGGFSETLNEREKMYYMKRGDFEIGFK